MFDDFVVQKRIRRFKKEIAVLKKDNFIVKFICDDKYFNAYEKIWQIVKEQNTLDELMLDIAFISDEYVSFFVKRKGRCFALNYSVESGFFERESVLLNYVGISCKRINKILKRANVKHVNFFLRLFLFSEGIGVICDESGEQIVKIRL